MLSEFSSAFSRKAKDDYDGCLLAGRIKADYDPEDLTSLEVQEALQVAEDMVRHIEKECHE